jgi:hypothetical protein
MTEEVRRFRCLGVLIFCGGLRLASIRFDIGMGGDSIVRIVLVLDMPPPIICRR